MQRDGDHRAHRRAAGDAEQIGLGERVAQSRPGAPRPRMPSAGADERGERRRAAGADVAHDRELHRASPSPTSARSTSAGARRIVPSITPAAPQDDERDDERGPPRVRCTSLHRAGMQQPRERYAPPRPAAGPGGRRASCRRRAAGRSRTARSARHRGSATYRARDSGAARIDVGIALNRSSTVIRGDGSGR